MKFYTEIHLAHPLDLIADGLALFPRRMAAIFYSVILNKSFGVQSKIWQRASMFSYLIALV